MTDKVPTKTKYKYIHFVKPESGNWECMTNRGKDYLGQLEWNPKWKQFEFVPAGAYVGFTQDCLTDISDFMRQLEQK
jgi:hypothetical protein